MKKDQSIALFNQKTVRRYWDEDSEVYEKIVQLKMVSPIHEFRT